MNGRCMKLFVCLASALSLLTACSAGGCYENHSAIPLAQFYSAETGSQISINNINIGGVGAPNDSLLLKAGTEANEVYLPFRYNTDKLTFHIEYVAEDNVPTGSDDVSFVYKAIPFFAGEACGAFYNYKIEDIQHTSNVLERIEVVDSIITNVDRAYMRFYFHTSTEDSTDPEEPAGL